MVGGDEVIFTGEYKEFKLGVKFNVDGKEPKDVASVLGFISSKIEPYAYKFSGIDTKKIDELASVSGKGSAAVISALESRPASALRESLIASATAKELLPAAESYFFNRLIEKAGLSSKETQPSVKPIEEKPDDFIGFMGKYKQWIAIKKLGLEKVQDYEVSGILAGVNHTIVNKAFEFSGQKKDHSAVEAATKGKRRSYGNIPLCLKELGSDDPYLVCKALELIGYKPYASPEMLTEAHPDIKPPKVKGRKPKGGKKWEREWVRAR